MKCDYLPKSKAKNWFCSREHGHEGPCAAHPVGFWYRMYWRYRLRSWKL